MVPLLEDQKVLDEIDQMELDQNKDAAWAVKPLEPYEGAKESKSEVKAPERIPRERFRVEYPSLSAAPDYLPEEFKNLRYAPPAPAPAPVA